MKCDQYWPVRGTETFGPIHVSLVDVVELATYTVRTFQLGRVRCQHYASNFMYPSLFVKKAQKHNVAVTCSGQDCETTMVRTKYIKLTKKAIAVDQINSEQLGNEIKTDSQFSMYNSNNYKHG